MNVTITLTLSVAEYTELRIAALSRRGMLIQRVSDATATAQSREQAEKDLFDLTEASDRLKDAYEHQLIYGKVTV